MYSEKGGYRKLAASFLYNIANGSFVWRNRFYAESASVTVEFNDERVIFNSLDLGIGDLSPTLTTQDVEAVLIHASNSSETVTRLVDAFEKALSGKGKILSCTVTWVSEVEELSEVFPSQEYVRESKREEGKNKILSGVMISGRKYATIHSQKIGAAIRNIDNWHGSDKTVPINPYAGDKQTGLALRRDAKTSPTLYDIMKKPESVIESLTSSSNADEMDYSVHFLIANFIRGGVFGIQDNAKS
jgi:CRISPR-associated protein Csy3